MSATYQEPVARLLALGELPAADALMDYRQLGLTAEHVPELLRLAQDQELLDAQIEGPEIWGPMHAWYALGQLRAEAAIQPLFSLFDQLDGEGGDECTVDDLPRALGMIGPALIPVVEAHLATPTHGFWARGMAVRCLAMMVEYFPETRASTVATITAELRRFAAQNELLNAMLIDLLCDLKATEAADLIEQAYAADVVDLSLMGDWEDARYRLGLRPDQPLQGPSLFERLTEGPSAPQAPTHRANPQKKAKRKQAKAARQRNRKRRR